MERCLEKGITATNDENFMTVISDMFVDQAGTFGGRYERWYERFGRGLKSIGHDISNFL